MGSKKLGSSLRSVSYSILGFSDIVCKNGLASEDLDITKIL